MTVQASHTAKARILVLHTPDAPELEVLKRLPADTTIVGIGRTLEDLSSASLKAFTRVKGSPGAEQTLNICAGCSLF